MKNELDYKVAVRAKEIFLNRNDFAYIHLLCSSFDKSYYICAPLNYRHPLFTYDNALQFGAKKRKNKIWWKRYDKKNRIQFLDWIIENS